MGALYNSIKLSTDYGKIPGGAPITDMFIWREGPVNTDGTAEYYVSRGAPKDYSVEKVEEYSLTGPLINYDYKIRTHPAYKFTHTYSDGAEICVARAILALHAEGLTK